MFYGLGTAAVSDIAVDMCMKHGHMKRYLYCLGSDSLHANTLQVSTHMRQRHDSYFKLYDGQFIYFMTFHALLLAFSIVVFVHICL